MRCVATQGTTPGQAKCYRLHMSDGIWPEVTVSGAVAPLAVQSTGSGGSYC